MTCPVCGGSTKVNDCRLNDDVFKRRRQCLVCRYRFNTIELDKDMYDRLTNLSDERFNNTMTNIQDLIDDAMERVKKELYKTVRERNKQDVDN